MYPQCGHAHILTTLLFFAAPQKGRDDRPGLDEMLKDAAESWPTSKRELLR
jgi:hypothetical protein